MEIKKRVLFLSFAIILIFNIYNVYAGLGMTPAIIRVDFQPNMSFLVSYGVLNALPDQNLMVSADGDLSEYVKFDKVRLVGQEGFTAYIDLPSHADKPGKNRLYIKVKEYNNESNGIGVAIEIGALILIKVPYPGKYAEINSFSVGNVNEGEPIRFYLELNNLGEEDITSNVNVDVYSNGKIFGNYPLGTKKITPNTMEAFESIINEKKYKPGTYEAFVSVNINDKNNTILRDNKTFSVGNLLVDIINWTREVNKSKINPYDIQIESKWNNDIKNIYAEVNVTKDGIEADFFKTPSIELKKWEVGNLQGFFNAEDLEEGLYKANINLFFQDQTISKIVDVMVVEPEKPKSDTIMLIIYGMIIGSATIAIIIFVVYLIIRRRGNAAKNKKRNR